MEGLAESNHRAVARIERVRARVGQDGAAVWRGRVPDPAEAAAPGFCDRGVEEGLGQRWEEDVVLQSLGAAGLGKEDVSAIGEGGYGDVAGAEPRGKPVAFLSWSTFRALHDGAPIRIVETNVDSFD